MEQFRLGKKVILCIPCEGKPYICDGLSGDILEDIQSVVGGFVERLDKKKIHIHPLFLQADKRWAMALNLIQGRGSVVYVNENGRYDRCMNMAMCYEKYKDIWWEKAMRNEEATEEDKKPIPSPLFGYIAVVVKWDYIKNKNYHLDGLKVHKVDNYSDTEDEDEDDE